MGLYENVCVRYNPIDTSEIETKMNEPINEKKDSRILLMAIGRLCYQKGYDRLLKIVKRLNEYGLQFNLWILGDGEDKEKVVKYIIDN